MTVMATTLTADIVAVRGRRLVSLEEEKGEEMGEEREGGGMTREIGEEEKVEERGRRQGK